MLKELNDIVKEFEKLHIEVIEAFFDEEIEGYNHPGLYYMAKSIDVMGKVDAVYFTKDWASARGCRIEREIAKAYGVKILDYDFLPKYAEEEAVPRTQYKTWKEYLEKKEAENEMLGIHDSVTLEYGQPKEVNINGKRYRPKDPLDPLSVLEEV